MWRISNFTFNTFYGFGSKTLWYIARRDPNMNILVSQKKTKKEEEKKGRRPPDVAIFEITCNLEEVFDFKLICENWNFEMRDDHPDYKSRRKESKALTFQIPRNMTSDALRNRRCTSHTTKWTAKGRETFTWPAITKEFVFRGTKTSITNSFFVVLVHSGGGPAFGSIGRSLMGLTSILDVSVFKGKVKMIETDPRMFIVGSIAGSIRCDMRSKGHKGVEIEEIPGGRPEQLKTNAMVTNLNRNEPHLIVFVKKCQGLAAGDPDKGTSDPYLRVGWDNMFQRCPTLRGTTRPVFNWFFYFPVRVFNPNLYKRKYWKNALTEELKSKGDVVIQVWHDEDTSSDSLGAVSVCMSDILSVKHKLKRTMLGQDPADSNAEENDFVKKPIKQWYEKSHDVRVFEGKKVTLTGCSLRNNDTPVMYFEAYFLKDWPDELRVEAPDEEENSSRKWTDKERAFNKEMMDFQKRYIGPFPESIGANKVKDDGTTRADHLRRFPCVAMHPQEYSVLPLMAFLIEIKTPEEYNWPPMLLHWTNCIFYHQSAKQARSGIIPQDGWKDPQHMLFTRKGPSQDHAILLCSVLLGSKKDAYVVKGTIYVDDLDKRKKLEDKGQDPDADPEHAPKRLIEHAWVMTREAENYVTFWEPCTGEVYHLPDRHRSERHRKAKKKRSESGQKKDGADEGVENQDGIVEAGEAEPAGSTQAGEEEWAFEVHDKLLSDQDLENMPTVGRMPRPKTKLQDRSKITSREKMKQMMSVQRQYLPIAPKRDLLDSNHLVDWLPYASIDVVFNNENLWANVQNHHPSCITYDFEEGDLEPPKSWNKLIKDKSDREYHVFSPIHMEVLFDPQLKPEKIAKLEKDMVAEMEENLRLTRGKAGRDFFPDRGEELERYLTKFLGIHENLRRLDVDFCPILDIEPKDRDQYQKYVLETLNYGKCKERYNKYRSAFADEKEWPGYAAKQAELWDQVMNEVRQFIDGMGFFPVKKGKDFSGKPMHFSTPDKEIIRGYLMDNDSFFKELCDIKDEENPVFTVHCKMWGLLGGVQSCWLYFGVQKLKPPS